MHHSIVVCRGMHARGKGGDMEQEQAAKVRCDIHSVHAGAKVKANATTTYTSARLAKSRRFTATLVRIRQGWGGGGRG